MKKTYLLLIPLVLLSFVCCKKDEASILPSEMLENITWIKQAAIKIEYNGTVVYIDPYSVKETDQADIVLITHDHGDHLEPASLTKVVTETTRITAPATCTAAIKTATNIDATVLEPGASLTIDGVFIEAVPAYNILKTSYHPKDKKYVGYMITIDGVKIYHAGDTELIPEMKDIDCDIALLPLGQTYTMNSVEEAAQAALDVKAEIAIPIHYGLYEGKASDTLTFQNLLAGKVDVIILQAQE